MKRLNLPKHETKYYFSRLLKDILVLILVIAPAGLYLGVSLLAQAAAPLDKAPYVHWNGLDPHSSVYVSWETSDVETSYVAYGTNPTSLTSFEENTTANTIHHIVLKSLSPNTKYYYRVGPLADDYLYGVHSFTTAPDTTVPFNFTLVSDTQQMWGVGHYSTIANAISQSGDMAFVGFVGDYGEFDDDIADYNYMTQETSKFSNRIPLAPINGNHDGEGNLTQYAKLFNISYYNSTSYGQLNNNPSKHYYSFNYSNVQFIMAEIADTGDTDPTKAFNFEQDLWINRTLQAGQAQDHRVLMFHRALYSANGNDDTLINRFMPIILKYNVSLVFNGHEHLYERFLAEDHTIVVLGGGGALVNGRAYSQDITQNIAVGASYTRVFFDGPNVEIRTLSPTGTVIDSVNLIKQGSDLIVT
jgi:hypothetical protein